MKITNIEVRSEGEVSVLSADVELESCGDSRKLWYRFEGLDGPLEYPADPFVAALLPFCMYQGESCDVEGTLSIALRQNAEGAQEVLAEWYDFLTPVSLSAEAETTEVVAASQRPLGGVACCFSGGVDSWYSLLKNSERVTHLVLVRGFDIGLENEVLWRRTRERAAKVGDALGLRLVTCETNLRDIADPRRAGWGRPCSEDFWGKCLHGAALASVSLGLSQSFAEIILPATHSEAQLKPWGSSPRLDPLWSNGHLQVRHDGTEADRLEKVRAISSSDLALRSLRVCHNDLAEMNCGRCEKCIRTMLALKLCGALDRAETFRDVTALRRLRRLEVPNHLLHHYESLLSEALSQGDRSVAQAVEAILGRRFSAERALATFVRGLRRPPSSPESGKAGPLEGYAQQG